MSKLGEVTTTGFKEADLLLKKLPHALKRKVLLAGQREAAKPAIKEMKQRLKASGIGSSTKKLEKSIGTKNLKAGRYKYKASTFHGARIGGRFKGYHAHLIEGGTKTRHAKGDGFLKFTTKDGKTIFTKKAAGLKARPFVDPAIKANIADIKKNYPKSIAIALDRYMKRYIKKSKR